MSDLISIVSEINDPIERNPAVVYLSSLGKGSRRTMKQALQVISRLNKVEDIFEMPWGELRYQHTQAIRNLLAENYAPATVNKMLSALKGVLKECWKLGLMEAEAYHRAIEIKQVKNQKLPRGRLVYQEEIKVLLSNCEKSTLKGARDLALFAIMFGCGLRRSEVVQLSLFDYDSSVGEIRILGAKGNKDRLTYITHGAKDALESWIEKRGKMPGPLFCRVRKGDRLDLKPLTTQAIYYLLRESTEKLGISAISPHDTRRTYITTLLEQGVDVGMVQKLAGHANVNTTLRYDRRGEREKREAAGKLNLPF